MKSIYHLRAVWIALIFVLAIESAPANDNPTVTASASKFLLRVNSTSQFYDFFRPWIKKPPFSRRGIGALIDGGRILVTADLIANSTFIELENPASTQKSTATVELVDYDCNLAVLRPADPAFLSGMQPIALDGPLKVGDQATILQLEPNGDIAQTLGRITSISVGSYPSDLRDLLLFKLVVPLQQRDGSFTLPAVRDDRLIGMLMRYDARNQSADIVPTAVIRHFLAELDSPTYQGFARLGMAFAPLRDPQLRRYIGLKEPGGIYVTGITPRGSADIAGIKKGDVILAMDGISIDQDGNYEDPDYGRIPFSHLTNTIKHPGTVLPFKILRNGQTLEIPVTMQVANDEQAISKTHLFDEAPKYVILGGLVFIELSRPYLKEWGNKWASSAPQRLVYYDAFQNELPADRGRIVILSQVLPTPDTIGYEDLENIVVTRVNGHPIKSLTDLSEAAKKPVDGFQKIEFEEDPKFVFLDAASIQSNAENLKKHYALPSLERL
jgi:S1-C subfamily serine protease